MMRTILLYAYFTTICIASPNCCPTHSTAICPSLCECCALWWFNFRRRIYCQVLLSGFLMTVMMIKWNINNEKEDDYHSPLHGRITLECLLACAPLSRPPLSLTVWSVLGWRMRSGEYHIRNFRPRSRQGLKLLCRSFRTRFNGPWIGRTYNCPDALTLYIIKHEINDFVCRGFGALWGI